MHTQKHPKAKQWHTRPFHLFDDMAELTEGSHALGEKKYRPKKPTDEEMPELSSILIDPVLLAESISQARLYSDIDSDTEVHSLSLAPSNIYMCIARAMLARTQTKIPTQTTNPKEGI